MKIKFGISKQKSRDITDVFLKSFTDNNTNIYIKKKTKLHKLLGDPYPYKVKTIWILDDNNNELHSFNENDILNKCIDYTLKDPLLSETENKSLSVTKEISDSVTKSLPEIAKINEVDLINVTNIIIKFGISEIQSIDVTRIFIKHFVNENNEIHIKKKYHLPTILGDPYPAKIKKIWILKNNKILYHFTESELLKQAISYNLPSTFINNQEEIVDSLSIPNYIINLKIREDKQHNMRIRLDQTRQRIVEQLNNTNYCFIEAIDKDHDIVKQLYNRYIANKSNPNIKNADAIGLIYSTILFFKQLENSKEDVVVILEDDIYFHKNYLQEYQKLKIYDYDLLYLGFNCYDKKVNETFKNMTETNDIMIPNTLKNPIYGTYGYVCNNKFRKYILELGIGWFVKNDYTLDHGYHIIRRQNILKYGLVTGEHLIIPDISDINSISGKRDESFYQTRLINKENYIIVNDKITLETSIELKVDNNNSNTNTNKILSNNKYSKRYDNPYNNANGNANCNGNKYNKYKSSITIRKYKTYRNY